MRARWSVTCAVLAALLLFSGLVAGLVNRNVMDADTFSHHVDAVRQDPAVSEQVGRTVAAKVIQTDPRLIVVRPAVESLSVALVRSSTLGPVVRNAATVLHRSITARDSGAISLRLLDVGTAVTGILPTISPRASEVIPPDLSVTLAKVSGHSASGWMIRLTRFAPLLSWLLPLLAALCFAGGIALAGDRQRAVVRTGSAVAFAGAAVGALAIAGSVVASTADRDTLHGALISAGWHEISGDVWSVAGVATLAGAVIAMVAAARLPGMDLPALRARVRGYVAGRPAGRRAVLSRGVVLIVIGAGALLRPQLVFGVLAGVLGIVLIVTGLGEIAFASGARPNATRREGMRRRLTSVGVLVLAIAVVAAMVAVAALPADRTVPTTSSTRTGRSGKACNGHVELCSRPYDEVAFPAAHNAMAAADESGWFAPEQPTGVIGSLDAGVRVMLIDSYYGRPAERRGLVITAPESYEAALASARRDFGQHVVDSAVRVRDAVTSKPVGPVDEYLCHGLCELGSTRWEPLMAKVHTWMKQHPRQVVTFVIEDSVSPADTAKVFRRAGLLPYVYTPTAGKPWPTLGRMIDSGHRLVVFSERRGGGKKYPWLLQGFDWIKDTPYSNPTVDSLSCDLNRGKASNDLLMLNYWLTGFHQLVANARLINSRRIMWPYVTRCEQERDHIPNFVAVNYYNEGDVFRVIDKLNGFG